MKLIDGDKLAEMLRSETVPMTEYGKGIHDGFAFAIAQIDTMEEAGRHGEWENHSSDDMDSESGIHTIATAQCSVCGRWCEQVRDLTGYVDYDFCPNCGADMDGDENAAD